MPMKFCWIHVIGTMGTKEDDLRGGPPLLWYDLMIFRGGHPLSTYLQWVDNFHRLVPLVKIALDGFNRWTPQYRSSWSRGSFPSSHARGQRFEPRCWLYFKLLLDTGDFHSNASGLLSFNKSETVLWTLFWRSRWCELYLDWIGNCICIVCTPDGTHFISELKT